MMVGGKDRRGLSLSQKGLLLVGVPAIFQVLLLASLFAFERAHDRARAAELRRKEVVVSAYRLLALLIDAETGMRGYLITQKPEFLEPYDRAVREIPKELSRLRALTESDRAVGELDQIAARATASLAFQTQNRQLIQSGARATALDRVQRGIGKQIMDAFRTSMDQLLAAEQRAAANEEQHSIQLRSRLNAALGVGTAANIAICVGLILLLTRSFTRRLSAVIENTYRLQQHQALLMPVGGEDEIGDLDRRIHDMAAALEKAENDLTRFFTISLEMLCIAGFDGFFKRLNPVWETVLGYSSQELYSRPFIDFVHPDDREATVAEAKRLAEGSTTVRFENRYRHADGSYRWLLWNAAALPEAKIIYAAATDITQRKQFESTLQDQNAALESANRELESFSYSVSHDLRAPLRAVDGYTRILEEEYGAALDDEARRLLNVIRSESRRMGVLIDDLLAFSRLSRQSLSWAEVDLGEISSEIIAEKRRRYPDRTIEFANGEAPIARADRSAIRQVLFNLIANAVKYSKPQAPIHIELGGRSSGDHNLYWVRDHGIGFDMRYAKKIFGVFQRLHSDGEIEGSGVGLAIVQRIIQRHGGRVWAEGEPGKGAVFFFTLPVTQIEIQEMELINERSGNSAGRG